MLLNSNPNKVIYNLTCSCNYTTVQRTSTRIEVSDVEIFAKTDINSNRESSLVHNLNMDSKPEVPVTQQLYKLSEKNQG